MKPTLLTPRMKLSGYDDQDFRKLFETKSDSEIQQILGLTDAEMPRYEKMHAEGFGAYNHSLFVFVLTDRESGEVMGECGFHSWNKQHRKAEIFYNLKEDSFKGKGLMSEALNVVLDFGFSQLQLNRIQALVADYNMPSIKLLEKYGFSSEGRLRGDYLVDGVFEDSDCYSLLKTEWEAR